MPVAEDEVIDNVNENEDEIVDEVGDNEVDNDSEKDSKRKSYKSEAEELKREVEALRKAVAERNKENEKRRKQIKQWEELGIDPDNVKEMLTEKERKEQAKLEEKGEWEKIKLKMVEERDRLLSEKDQEVQAMRQALETTLWDKGIETELLSNGADAPELVKDKVKAMTKLIEENGVFEVAVLDEHGEIRYTKDGDRMKLKDVIPELKEHPIYGRAFAAPNIGGMGTKMQGAGSSKSKPESSATKKPRSDMTQAEKKAYITEHGIEKYNALPLK